ncbi:MAG: calcium-binding protein, partial [Pseudomonadales bacterium]
MRDYFFGNIVGQTGEYTEGSPDWDSARVGDTDDIIDSRELISAGEDLAQAWNDVVQSMSDIDSENHDYYPGESNSNAAVDEALRRAGLPEPVLDGIGDNWSPGSGWDLPGGGDTPSGFGKDLLKKITDNISEVNEGVRNSFQDALNWVLRTEPLVLDLDGDGIETIAADGSILFDYDGDGVKNGTGWVSADDGMLVLDRNGNGSIDNGSELFGDNTLKADGTMAIHGFDALAELDINDDGLVNANDTQFIDLRIWKDLNQDGISQANELFSLSDLNIESLSTDSVSSTINIGNNNQSIAQSFYTKTDGTEGAAESLDFATNNFYRKFIDKISIPDNLKYLPSMQGSGAVRDLMEAAALSPELALVLIQYTSAASKIDQEGLLDRMLIRWANTAGFDTLSDRLDRWNSNNPSDVRSYGGDYESGTITSVNDKLQVLEVFNNNIFGNVQNLINVNGSTTLSGPQQNSLDDAYESLRKSVYDGLLLQTRLKSYIEAINLTFIDGEIALDFNDVEIVFSDNLIIDSIKAVGDFLDFSQIAQDTFNLHQWEPLEHLQSQLANSPYLNAEMDLLLTSFDVKILDLSETIYVAETAGMYILGNTQDNELSGSAGDDTLLGGGGDDTLQSTGGSDTLLGGAGDDTLVTSSTGDDILDGGTGNDILTASFQSNAELFGGEGNDTLRVSSSLNSRYYQYSHTGGKGNDSINGSFGSDAYYFNRGDGQDTIYDYSGGYSNEDRIVFGAGIAASDITVITDPATYNLTLIIADPNNPISNDQITINSFMGSNRRFLVEVLEFSDGTVWTGEDLFQQGLTITGTEFDDTLSGYSGSNDILFGLSGNDTLTSTGGDDILHGGAGDDTLQATQGSDTLLGGAGDDTLVTSSTGD